jgi:Fibronectin type III domain
MEEHHFFKRLEHIFNSFLEKIMTINTAAISAAVDAAVAALASETPALTALKAENDALKADAAAAQATIDALTKKLQMALAVVPAAPTNVSAVVGDAKATVDFTPGSDGGSPVTGFTVTSNPAGGSDSNAGGTTTTHVMTGLTNGTPYTFTAVATNAVGGSPISAPSNSITPAPVVVPVVHPIVP